MATELEMELMGLLAKITEAYDRKPWGKPGEGPDVDPEVREMMAKADQLLDRWEAGSQRLFDS